MNGTAQDTIETGDVIELEHDGEWISALVLLASENAIILDACDASTPFVVRRVDLNEFRRFVPES